MPKFCSNCGSPLDAEAKFCAECGKPVASAATPASPATAAPTVSADSTEKLQAELYGLYKVLEPVRELDLAGRAVDAKIAELSEPQPKATQSFRVDFSYYAPFISVELDENFITPSNKKDAKNWKAFIKGQNDKLHGENYDETGKTKYSVEKVFYLFKENKSKVLQDLGASFLYYKMAYCFEEPKYPYSFNEVCMWDKRCKRVDRYEIIDMLQFINFYLEEKLGDEQDKYLIRLFTKLKGGNKGEVQLCDMPIGYAQANVSASSYKSFFPDDFPEVREYRKRPYNMSEIEEAAKKRLQKSLHTKREIDGSLAELRKMRGQINSAISEYMEKQVDLYINKNVKIVPLNYARKWECVAYFLYLLINKRGRDIYEVINQYEIDMKHKELTSALGDIRSEIRSQTQILGNKLDDINRSIVEQTEAITSAIAAQTKVLGAKLDDINYSVISTGASVVGAISQLGAAMGQAMSNMKVNVSVS